MERSTIPSWTSSDSQRAEQLWTDFLARNDTSALKGKAAGIDPKSGQIWFGESARDIVRQMDEQGIAVPLFFVRVGFPTYLRKGGRR